jgi:RNA polymerase sigma-70 factor (ECF subfamily)
VDASVTTRLKAGAPSDGEGRTFDTFAEHHRIEEADLSDEGLMTQVCAGSMEALAVLFRRYARLVRTVAMRILRDDSEADDLLQEVFLFVHRNCSRFDSSKSALRSWIVQMTYHRAIDRRRYLNSRCFYTRLDLDEAARLPDPGLESREETIPLDSLVGNTTMQGLLDSLTEDQRNTLSLHFVEGYSFDEIAAKLNQSLGNIRNHYYRGLEKLRKQMFPGKLPGRNGHGRK